MPFSRLRISLPPQSINHLPKTPLSPLLYHMANCSQLQASSKQSIYCVSLVKHKSSSPGVISSTIVQASQALDLADAENTSHFGQYSEQKEISASCKEQNLTDEFQFNGMTNNTGISIDEAQKESHRRRKIGQANKGKVPWNKGRKHSAETRERIRQRTKEAMMDPKVRKKMAESPRAHSAQTKARIRSSLRRLWCERLKVKRSKAKFLSSWAESIAEAARKGGSDQHELQWNSYDKMKEEIALQHHQWAAEQAKAKEMARIQASQAKVERIARQAEKRKELEQKAKARGEIKRKTYRKSKEEKEEWTIVEGLKLKERLTKIHRRKSSTNGQIYSEDQKTWERLDLAFIKRERPRQEVSLADQIKAAKSKRLEVVHGESFPTSSSL
ncbi:hypothetical protein NMG60_11036987 [Bertholletia excelsa]